MAVGKVWCHSSLSPASVSLPGSLPVTPSLLPALNAQPDHPHSDFSSLRFTPELVGGDIQLSASGLVARMGATEKQLAGMNKTFTRGVHYWEIVCPVSCACLEFGVMQGGASFATAGTSAFVKFKNSTPRIVGVELNLYTLRVSFYLNGRLQDKKFITVSPGPWKPALWMQDKDTVAVVNPYCYSQENYWGSYIHHKGLSTLFSPWLCLSFPFQPRPPSDFLPLSAHITSYLPPSAPASPCSFLFLKLDSPSAATELLAQLITTSVIVVPGYVLESWAEDLRFTVDNKDFADARLWLRENTAQFYDTPPYLPFDSLCDLLAQAKSPSIVTSFPQPLPEVTLYYLPHTDNLLAVCGDRLKLVPKRHGRLIVSPCLFLEPQERGDQVWLEVSHRESKAVVESLERRRGAGWSKETGEIVQALGTVVEVDGQRYIHGSYECLTLSVQHILYILFKSPSGPTIPDHDLISLETLMRLEEELRLLTPAGCNDLWPERVSRVNTAITRLSSLVCASNRRELAQAGLVNTKDWLKSYSYYQAPNVVLNSSADLEGQLPNERLLMGLPAPSVPLSIEISARSQRHPGLCQVVADPDSPWVLTFSLDGVVRMWDTSLTLTEMVVVDLTKFGDSVEGRRNDMDKETQREEDQILHMFLEDFEAPEASPSPTEVRKMTGSPILAAFVNLENQPETPLVLCTVSTNGEVVLKRIGFTDEYLRRFMLVTKTDNGYHSVLSGTWLEEASEAREHFCCYKEVMRTLIPSSAGLSHSSLWTVIESQDVTLPSSSITSLCVSACTTTENQFSVYILGCDSAGPTLFEVSVVLAPHKDSMKGLVISSVLQTAIRLEGLDQCLSLVCTETYLCGVEERQVKLWTKRDMAPCGFVAPSGPIRAVIRGKGDALEALVDGSIETITLPHQSAPTDTTHTKEITTGDLFDLSDRIRLCPQPLLADEFFGYLEGPAASPVRITGKLWVSATTTSPIDQLLVQTYHTGVHFQAGGKRERMSDSGGQLPLMVYCHTGGCYKEGHYPSAILNNDEQPFTSIYPAPTFTFRHLMDVPFIPTSFTLKSNLSAQSGQPLGEGLLFSASYPSLFQYNSLFDEYHEADFNKYVSEKKARGEEFEEWEPVGFFRFEEGDTVTGNFVVQRECRYVFLKPTNIRPTPTKKFKDSQIEILYFSLSGHDILPPKPYSPALPPLPLALTLHIFQHDQWVPISSTPVSHPEKPLFGSKAEFSIGKTVIGGVDLPCGTQFRLEITGEPSCFPAFFSISGLSHRTPSIKREIARALPIAITAVLESDTSEWVHAGAKFLSQYFSTKPDLSALKSALPLGQLLPRGLKYPALLDICDKLWSIDEELTIALDILPKLDEFAPDISSLPRYFAILSTCSDSSPQETALSKLISLSFQALSLRQSDLLKFQSICCVGDLNPFETTAYLRAKKLTPLPMHVSLTWNESSDKLSVRLTRKYRLNRVIFVFKKGKDEQETVRCRVDIVVKGEIAASMVCEEQLYRQLSKSGHPISMEVDCAVDRFTVVISYFLFPNKRALDSEYFIYLAAFGDPLEAESSLPEVPPDHTNSEQVTVWGNWTQTEYTYEQDLMVAVYTGKQGSVSQLQLNLAKKQSQLRTLLTKIRPEVIAVEAIANEISEIQEELSGVGVGSGRSYQMTVNIAAEIAGFLVNGGCKAKREIGEMERLFVELVAKGNGGVREKVLELVGLLVAQSSPEFRLEFISSLIRAFLTPGSLPFTSVSKGLIQGVKFLRAPSALILQIIVQTEKFDSLSITSMLELCLYSLQRASTPQSELQTAFTDLLATLARLKSEDAMAVGLRLMLEYTNQLPAEHVESALQSKPQCQAIISRAMEASLTSGLYPVLAKSQTLSEQLFVMLTTAIAERNSGLIAKLLQLYLRIEHKPGVEAVLSALVPVLEENSASVDIWKLVLSLCRTLPSQVQTVVRLIPTFLSAEETIRQTLYSDVVEVSRVILTEMSGGELLNMMLEAYARGIDSQGEASTQSLCRGWGELLLQHQGKLSAAEGQRLLEVVGELLEGRLRVGGIEAASGMSVAVIMRLEFVHMLLSILMKSFPTDPDFHPTESSLFRLLTWLMLTMSKDESEIDEGFPALLSLKQIVSKLYQLLEKLSPAVSKLLLKAAVSRAREYSEEILRKVRRREMMAVMGLSTANRLMSSFLTIVDLVLTSDELAAYFAFEVKGFEFLMEQLICESQDQTSPLDDEELASKMVMVNLAGMGFASISAGIDWATYKKGNRNKLFTREFDSKEKFEIALAFELQKSVELRHVSVGFNLFSTETADRVYGMPASVLLEGGESLEELRPIAQMKLIPDFAYAHFSVGVFAHNFVEGPLPKSFRVKFLCFRVRRPVYSCIETSTLLLKNCSKAALSISFISVMGYDQELLNDVPLLISGVYKLCALKLFSRICKPEYTHTMEVISHEQEVLAQIKGSFEMLAAMLHLHESWLAHVLSQLSRSNEGMAGWLLSSLLKLSRGPEHARLVYDIIQNDQKHAQERVQQLSDFVFWSIAELNKGSEAEVSSRYAPLISFVEALASTVGNLGEEGVQLRVEGRQLEDLIVAIRLNVETSEHTKSLSRLLMCLLYPQAGLRILSDFDLESSLLSSVFPETVSTPTKTGFEDCIKCVVAYSDRAAEWILSDARLQSILDTVESLCEGKEEHRSTKCADLLCGFSTSGRIKAYLREIAYSQRLYTRLKQAKSGSKFLLKGVRTLCNLVLGDPSEERSLSDSLTKDIAELQAAGLIHDLLVPLLSAELKFPVFLHVFDPYNGRWVSAISQKSQGAVVQPMPFVAKTCSPQQMAEIAKSLQTIADSSEDKKSLMTAPWNQLYYLDHPPDCSTWLTFHRALELRAPVVLLFQAESRTRGEINVAVASFKPIPQVPDVFEDEVTASIPFDKDNFILYMEESKTFHFDSAAVPQRQFGEVLCDYEGGGALNLAGEFLWLSFSYDYSTCIDNSGFLICREKNCTLPGEIKVKSLEVWGCQLQDDRSSSKSPDLMSKRMPWEDAEHPLALLQPVPLLAVPESVSVECFCAALFQGWVEVGIRGAGRPLLRSENIHLISPDKPALNLEYRLSQRKEAFSAVPVSTPRFSLFESFQSIGGISEILNFAQKSLKSKGDGSESGAWVLWIHEIQSFFQLPTFFSSFIRSENCKNLLFAVLSGDAQAKDEALSITHTYRTLAEIFRANKGQDIRQQAFQTGLIERVLERLEVVDKVQRLPPSTPSPRSRGSSCDSVYSLGSEAKSDKKGKGGVGYAPDHAGNTSNWNVNSYLQSKQTQLEQKTVLIEVLTEFLEPAAWKLPEEVAKMVMGSQLGRFLDQNLGGDSLLEIDKEKEMFSTFLRLVKVISGHETLQSLLTSSLPRLSKLADLARTFFKCLQKVDTSEKHAEALARDIITTEEFILRKSSKLTHSDRKQFYAHALHQPLEETYRLLLEEQRMDNMRMKGENGSYQHFYSGQLARMGNTPPGEKMYRLAREIADLSHSLPISHTNSIFVRVDEERVDLMKAMIMGAAGTPYAHGVFEFDIFLEDSYPNSPPKVNLMTTGGEQVRFNPNLYSCGKVCLSLLGTWRGYATENWDPKISTLLQVLMSIQSMIMTDDIYFNEPGFEQEVNTDEGNKKNEGYCNIVRYANTKFSMLEQIRHPPKGFEVVVRRHFYLKREEILEDLKKWLANAKEKEANYTGLVLDHNPTFAGWFRESKEAYYEKLLEVYTELEEELNSLPEPTPEDRSHASSSVPHSSPKEQTREVLSLPSIDVSDDQSHSLKAMNVDSKEVTDRYSRYIGAMGVDAVRKQAESEVFLAGAGPLAAEIAKNLVLSGVKRLVVCDHRTVSQHDLPGHCFLRASDLSRNRALSVSPRLQQLNYYVQVDSQPTAFTLSSFPSFSLSQYSLVILTEMPWDTAATIAQFCRENGTKVVCADCFGLFARGFCDFGAEFAVSDPNGEPLQDYVIDSITREAHGLVKLLGNTKHNLEDGSQVVISGVSGMDGVNGTSHSVIVVNTNSFRIGNTADFGEYVGGGVAAQVKVPVIVQFESLSENLKVPRLDQTFQNADFEKIELCAPQHWAMQALDRFILAHDRLPDPHSAEDRSEGETILSELIDACGGSVEGRDIAWKLINTLWNCAAGTFPPLTAIMGGIMAQEAIKAITHKFTPIRQLIYLNSVELAVDTPPPPHVSNPIEICLGGQVVAQLQASSAFMVGVGAIGCELLKNLALLSFASAGKLTITDPDLIENSNLSRQFLFREKHLRLAKAAVAAAAVIDLTPSLSDHISARLDKVHEATSHIFTEEFFQAQTVVLNALDNIQARKYVDQRCVAARRPLVDSGTLGTKGHVQVVLPFLTETYSERSDPEDEQSIPVCTLKMFPEETLHCIEWGRDLFARYFTSGPGVIRAYVLNPESQFEGEKVVKALSILRKWPKSFEDCVYFAWRKFHKLFHGDVSRLLHVYPADCQTKDGKPFWSLPKRKPTPVQFVPDEPDHVAFLVSAAYLKASVCGVVRPSLSPEESAQKVVEIAQSFPVKRFKVSESQATAIRAQVDSQLNEQPGLVPNPGESAAELRTLLKTRLYESRPEEFEKDKDDNRHVDFVAAAANCRAQAYNLPKSDWITAKIKAGRIVPALATTTAVVAGLQALEVVKIVKGVQASGYRNVFLNLAASVCTMTEPSPPRAFLKLEHIGTTTAWSRWEIPLSTVPTLSSLFSHLHSTYKISIRDVLHASRPIYLHSLMSLPGKSEEREKVLESPLWEVLGESGEGWDLRVTFVVEGGEEMMQSPVVRVR